MKGKCNDDCLGCGCPYEECDPWCPGDLRAECSKCGRQIFPSTNSEIAWEDMDEQGCYQSSWHQHSPKR